MGRARAVRLMFVACTAASLAANTLGADILPPQDRPEAFRQLDVDGDGWITREEAAVHPEVSANFSNSDADSDGRLSLSEFEKVPLNRSDQPGAFQTLERG